MNTKTNPQQIESVEYIAKATADLNESIEKDLGQQDKGLSELIGLDTDECMIFGKEIIVHNISLPTNQE